MSRTIILDFDYTLFDAKKFKKALAKSLVPFGIDEKTWRITYEQSKFCHGVKKEYLPEKHLKTLANRFNLDFEKLKSAYLPVIKKTVVFIYPDTILFLEKLKGEKNELYLVTYGNPTWQEQKIKTSGIGKYFKKIICTDRKKFETTCKIPGADEALFINDNPNEIAALKIIHPKADFIQIKRSNGKKFALKLKDIKIISDLKIKI